MSTSISVAPSSAQIALMAKLGLSPAATSSECSRMIDAKLAEINSVPATAKQKGRLGALGGRDLPGGNIREVSTAIYLAEAVALYDQAVQASDYAGGQEALLLLLSRTRERLMKPARTAPVGVVVKVDPSGLLSVPASTPDGIHQVSALESAPF
jgi:hypothetical protein